MEDISMLLNSGDVPNLFPADEKAEIVDKMQTHARNEVTEHYRYYHEFVIFEH